MSHRVRSPRWLRDAVEAVRLAAALQSPKGITAIVRKVAEDHDLTPEQVASMIAAEGDRQGVTNPAMRRSVN